MGSQYKFALSTDSTCDLYADFIKENDIYFVPLSFNIEKDGQFYLMLDHWKPEDLKNSGYSILPIEIEDGHLTIPFREYTEF